MYFDGRSVPQDDGEVAKWFRHYPRVSQAGATSGAGWRVRAPDVACAFRRNGSVHRIALKPARVDITWIESSGPAASSVDVLRGVGSSRNRPASRFLCLLLSLPSFPTRRSVAFRLEEQPQNFADHISLGPIVVLGVVPQRLPKVSAEPKDHPLAIPLPSPAAPSPCVGRQAA